MNRAVTETHDPSALFFCVSLNPAIDTRLVLDALLPGRVNRAREVHRAPGGKAAHVAIALRGLGAAPVWIGFSGGATGRELLAGLKDLGIEVTAIPTSERSRINLEILDIRGEVTEILEPGGTIAQSEWSEFQQICNDALQSPAKRKIAVLSGSQPPGVPAEAGAVLVKAAQSKNCMAFIDSSGLGLSKALGAGPNLVKINREEAEVVTQIAISDPLSAASAARKLLELGAKSAVISIGARGMVGVPSRNQPAIHVWTTPLHAKSTVGCGDAALAGLAFGAAIDLSFEKSLALAVACGAANCLARLPALIAQEDVSRLEKDVHIESLSE